MEMPLTNPESRVPREPLPTSPETGAFLPDTSYWKRPRLIARDYVPQKPLFTDHEAEIDFYSRTAFTAWEYALSCAAHHPKLWDAVKGSPYEHQYRERFNPET